MVKRTTTTESSTQRYTWEDLVSLSDIELASLAVEIQKGEPDYGPLYAIIKARMIAKKFRGVMYKKMDDPEIFRRYLDINYPQLGEDDKAALIKGYKQSYLLDLESLEDILTAD